jgi:hypothetical protein
MKSASCLCVSAYPQALNFLFIRASDFRKLSYDLSVPVMKSSTEEMSLCPDFKNLHDRLHPTVFGITVIQAIHLYNQTDFPSYTLQWCRWRQYILPKRRYLPVKLNGARAQSNHHRVNLRVYTQQLLGEHFEVNFGIATVRMFFCFMATDNE